MQRRRVEQAFSEYVDTVLRAAWHVTGEMHAAEDCTQEAFLRLLAASDAMEEDRVLPWLLRTAINLAKDYLKSAEHSRTVSLEENDTFMQTNFSPRDESIMNLVMQLPQEVRVPMCLHFVEGYSIDETAEMLHIPRSTVASRIRRARKKLKELTKFNSQERRMHAHEF